MTPTQRGRRADSLYQDGSTNRRMLCDIIVQREVEIEQLKELASDMYEYIRVVGYAGRTIKEQMAIADDFADRMQELRVIRE